MGSTLIISNVMLASGVAMSLIAWRAALVDTVYIFYSVPLWILCWLFLVAAFVRLSLSKKYLIDKAGIRTFRGYRLMFLCISIWFVIAFRTT